MNKVVPVLFNVWADEDNFDAQSLNAREIALRLDPARFRTAVFAQRPDPRLMDAPGVRIVRLPRRLRSVAIVKELVWGRHDIIVYPPIDILDGAYRRLRWMGARTRTIFPIEGTADQVKSGLAADVVLRSLREADRVVAISPFIAETIEPILGTRPPIIPLGVDHHRFAFTDRLDYEPPVKVLTLSSIQPRKRIHVVLDVASTFKPGEAEFHVVGDPIGGHDYRDELLAAVEARGLANVHFHPGCRYGEVARWMFDSDVLLLPSRLEGTPRVTFEAAATGLPCVVFEDYHTPSVVDGATGYQVSSDAELAESVSQLVRDFDLRRRLGVAAHAHMENFSWDRVARGWEELLESTALSNSD